MESELKRKTELLHAMGRIYDQAGESKLKPRLFEKINDELEKVSAYMGMSQDETFMLVILVVHSLKNRRVCLSELLEHLECNPMQFVALGDAMSVLEAKKYVKVSHGWLNYESTTDEKRFMVHQKVIAAILSAQPIPTLNDGVSNAIELLEQIVNMADNRYEDGISSSLVFDQCKELMENHKNFPLIAHILDCPLSLPDYFLYAKLIWWSLSGRLVMDIAQTADDMFDRSTEKVDYLQQFYSNTNRLQNLGLVEWTEGDFFSQAEIGLAPLSVQNIQQTGLKIYTPKKKRNSITEASAIKEKWLYFNSEEEKQITTLQNFLKEGNLKKARRRLTMKNLPTGVTILLHGQPGTGKTELVLQTARQTGRSIMKVDISHSKSMWYGESEKMVKRIFTEYAGFKRECKLTPILLFNEADAIFSRRVDIEHSSTSATHNATQNILLEELENFDGIFFATTNLTANLDKAFERRFLFKIKFQPPDDRIRGKIWQSKSTGLWTGECTQLARMFDLSGGQIDNVVRKLEIDQVVNGGKINFERILELCRQECIDPSVGHSIGFKKAC